MSLPVAAGLGWHEEIELRRNSKSKQTVRANLVHYSISVAKL